MHERESLQTSFLHQVESGLYDGRIICATAAKGEGSSLSVFVVRYAASNDVTDTGAVVLRIPGRSLAKARCHITDAVRTHTEVPLDIQADGTGLFSLMPDSFALIEID